MTFEGQRKPRNLDGRYFRDQNELIDVYAARIGPNALAVFIVLSRYADNKTSKVKGLTARRIGRLLGRGRTFVFQELNLLEEAGLITRRCTGRENEYVLLCLKGRPKRAITHETGIPISRPDDEGGFQSGSKHPDGRRSRFTSPHSSRDSHAPREKKLSRISESDLTDTLELDSTFDQLGEGDDDESEL